MKGKKKLMIEALQKQLGVVTAAVKDVGIARRTHYDWINDDPEYREAVENLPEFVLDFAENALFKLIQEKNVAATIFFLKTKGRSRGYIERPDIHISQEVNKGIVYRFEVTDANKHKIIKETT